MDKELKELIESIVSSPTADMMTFCVSQKNLAVMIGVFYVGLRDLGVDAAAALELTKINYARLMMTPT